jgi:hypothetical protein
MRGIFRTRMAFDYQRDDITRRVTVAYSGDFQAAEGLAILQRNRAEGVGAYALLYDLSHLTGHPSVDDMKRFIEEELKNTTPNGVRGPVAIVASEETIYRMACTYAVLGGHRLKIKVFRERVEADAWLRQNQR